MVYYENVTAVNRFRFELKEGDPEMFKKYGTDRVLEPKSVLPTSAWRVDNSREISPNEIRVAIRRIHLEPTSFKQICLEAGNNEEKIRQKIMDITIRRGKLHNPITDTGGLFYGIVEKIGSEYTNAKGLKVGDEVICNASLTGIPMYLSKVTKLYPAYTQIEAEGYAIVFGDVPLIKKPDNVPIDLLLFAFNESGTLYRVSKESLGKKHFLIVGNNIMMNMLFGFVVRKIVGVDAEIICLFDKKTDITIKGKGIDELLAKIFTEIHYVNILRPVECIEKLNAEGYFDLSVNCADIPGAETVNILATKSGGTVIFANFINNYNIALYITESISRQLDIICAEGYLYQYDEFDIEIVKELAPYLEWAIPVSNKIEENLNYPISREERILENTGYRKVLAEEFICESRIMAQLLEEMLSVAKYDCNVIITGNTGVGKEKVANIIQKNSARKMQPFMKINCAAISPNLMESEFFGYEKGAFTGANMSGKKGYFEMADNGIIFLDEVGELPLDIQAKLLRVIQDGQFFRVGGTKPVKTNVRILSATNRDLEKLIEEKLFRRDLYYRLNVFPIRVPDLSERKSEMPALVKHFIETYNEKFSIKKEIEEEAIEYLQQCDWPGNIRELENAIQRILIGSKSDSITLLDVMKALKSDLFENLSLEAGENQFANEKIISLDDVVGSFEKNIIKYACEKYGSTRKAAKGIGISQTQLIRKKKKYEL